MVRRNEAFPSKYLKADDLDGEAVVATIKSASLDTLKGFDGKEQRKVILYFSRTLKPLPLNMVNFDSVADILGEESDDWPGGKIELYPTTTTMNGVVRACVRVRKPDVPAKKKAKPAAPAAAEADDMDDAIPF
jgi:hypothetical protein